MFPTRVGVNRLMSEWIAEAMRVPHASGGEPMRMWMGLTEAVCSPREWG